MKPKKTIAACLKALSYLAIICALMFLPSSATHAASGIHGDHHAASVSSDQAVPKHAHEAASSESMHGASGSASQADQKDQASGQCCNGLCVSVVLDDTDIPFVKQATRDKYLMVLAQPDSIEPTGFLRPPLYLI
ncbi:hypothetical protein DC366_15760 [Pelagivirga sediminicola]|uniref:DUF2946 domain-containing protein n=1 Tax=Pelagivirga sediminicola TaxID=2170575 RepID=A0A2T7G3N0_9RHOB|nr:hypothetical protein DC366_15760 [Pelagivirga sediminicola]